MDVDIATMITSVVTFLILLVILTKFAWKPILNGLQKREETIRKAVDDAQKASEEAQALLRQYEQKLDSATDEARKISEQAQKNAELVKQKIEDDAQTTAKATLERSVKEIEQAKQTAIDEILHDVTALATEAASRIIKKELTPADNAALVDDLVKQFADSRDGSGA
jgi:F-type H+-transporting ATPase subunit b